MKRVFLSILVSFLSLYAFAQLQMDIGRIGNGPAQYTFFDIDGNTKEIPYSRIKGSPFWKDEWLTANILLDHNKSAGIYQARLNMATNEVYFLNDKDQIKVAEYGLVKKVVFYKDKDTSGVVGVFCSGDPYIFGKKDEGEFAQVLNFGKIQLLKITERKVNSADSLLGTMKRYYFKDELKYFIYARGRTEKLRKLNKESVLFLLPASDKYEAWIRENNIKFSREQDVIKFLNYYNLQEP
jgi:hypothetical protein